MDPTTVDPVTLASATGIAIGLTTVVKDAVPQLPSRYIPALAITLGVALAMLWLASDHALTLSDVVAALVAAFAGVGVHQGVVHTARGE